MRIAPFILFILLFSSSNAQDLIFNSRPKKGVYKNFYEFKYNRPSLPFNYELLPEEKRSGPMALGELHVFYRIDLGKEKPEELDRIFGLCDGEDIYINLGGGKTSKNTDFARIDFLGRYSIYTDLVITTPVYPTYTGGNYLVPTIIDVIDGQIFPVSATIVDDLIKDDSELYDLYIHEKRKEEVAIDYIKRYCERNLHRHIINPLINDSTLLMLDSDASYEDYLQRIIDFRIDTTIIDVELRKYYYGKNRLKMIGLKVKHERGKNEDYYYKAGTWRTYYKNGNLKSEINYDFRERKHGRILLYDQDGKLEKEEYYNHGSEIR